MGFGQKYEDCFAYHHAGVGSEEMGSTYMSISCWRPSDVSEQLRDPERSLAERQCRFDWPCRWVEETNRCAVDDRSRWIIKQYRGFVWWVQCDGFQSCEVCLPGGKRAKGKLRDPVHEIASGIRHHRRAGWSN